LKLYLAFQCLSLYLQSTQIPLWYSTLLCLHINHNLSNLLKSSHIIYFHYFLFLLTLNQSIFLFIYVVLYLLSFSKILLQIICFSRYFGFLLYHYLILQIYNRILIIYSNRILLFKYNAIITHSFLINTILTFIINHIHISVNYSLLYHYCLLI
jgi:hypothetical protein